MVWDLCSMDSSNITKEFSEKRKRKIPLGTKGRTSILSIESSASCGASFPVSRRKLPDRECFVTSFRQGSYTPLRRLCGYPLWTCRLQTVLTNRSPPASLKIKNLNLIKECDSMKKKLPIILLGVILACVLVFGFLYANNDIGKTANSLEADIRQSQKILDDWIVDGSISDTMAAFISYPQDKTDHTFSVYVNRPGLSFGYFFRGGGDIVEVDDYIAEFVVEGNNERAFISMNTQNIVRLEVDDGNGIQVIDIDSGKPFAIVLPLNVGNICFYDTNGNVVEYLRQQL